MLNNLWALVNAVPGLVSSFHCYETYFVLFSLTTRWCELCRFASFHSAARYVWDVLGASCEVILVQFCYIVE